MFGEILILETIFKAQNIYFFPNGATSLLVPTLQVSTLPASAIYLANLKSRSKGSLEKGKSRNAATEKIRI